MAAAYKNEQTPENLICKFVSNIGFDNGKIVLTDILGENIAIEGKLSTVDLVKNVVVIQCA
ncbi:MAG: CooT family nickel-binding protein [Lachnospiraceae bacterium]|uniref:CooT family nickel-binding protein n=1 Tax=Hominifimenecus microfluidus TaxID=2885348 RepID=UPI0027E48BE6|nr:CooT family nickel-binding protein [Hominifimenecus microfluidus]